MTDKTKIIWGIVAAVILIGGIWYASSRKSVMNEKEPIKIGIMGPLTGDLASLGQNSKLAVDIAIEEINQAGGINGRLLQVIYEDTKCNPKDGADAGAKLMNVDHVSAIIGGVCSSETLAVAPIAEQTKTVVLSHCASAPSVSNAGDYIFRVYPSDSFQGKYLASYVFNNLGVKKAAILFCLSDYCEGLRSTFRKGFEELGGQIVSEEGYEQSARDLRSQLTKIKKANPDGIYFASYTEAAIPGIKQFKEMGMNAKLFGADAWDDPKIWDSVGAAGNGSLFTVVAPSAKGFQEKFSNKTGKNDLTICAPQAYDAINIIANIMKKVGTNGESIKNELYAVKNYQGVSGLINFDSNGDLSSGNYIIKVVKDGKVVPYEK